MFYEVTFLHYSKRILLVFNKTTQILQSSISLQIGGTEQKLNILSEL